MKLDALFVGLTSAAVGFVIGVGTYAAIVAVVWAEEKLRLTEKDNNDE